MYIDIMGSTQMYYVLTPLDLSVIIQIFFQEVSISIMRFGGHVIKFVGDVVIALFPSYYDPNKAIMNCLDSAQHIQQVIKEGINSISKVFSS